MMQKGDPTNSLNVLQVDANAAIDEMLVGHFRYGFDLSKDGGYPKMAISISVVFL